jgi:4,5-DOPA dioxygenase extradiol
VPTVPGSPPTDPRRAQFITHGAPPTLDDARWLDSLFTWSQSVPEPRAVVVSAHWENALLPISASAAGTPLL